MLPEYLERLVAMQIRGYVQVAPGQWVPTYLPGGQTGRSGTINRSWWPYEGSGTVEEWSCLQALLGLCL